ncbi:probable glucan 1,3-beta-glucosidase A [Tanacetum coccineum]
MVDLVTADAQGDGPLANDDPSVFSMMITKRLTGEYQLTNGYDPNNVPQIMEDHWSTYIVEADFEFIAQNGLNAVRIPVGWWIAFDPTMPPPYVGGSRLQLNEVYYQLNPNQRRFIENEMTPVKIRIRHFQQVSINGLDPFDFLEVACYILV